MVVGTAGTMRVAVVGGGSWGTTVASLTAAHGPTVLWARRPEVVEAVNTVHANPEFLPGAELHADLRASASIRETVADADVVVMAVPSQGFRSVLVEAAPHVRAWVPVVSLSKGLEEGTRLRMSEVAGEVLPGHPVAVLTGPNLASEIAAGQPAAAVVAIDDAVIARALQELFSAPHFRVYTNSDVTGCEISGVVKNVIAIASGIVHGLGLGENTKAALITRGLAEMTRLAVALGGDALSVAGLAGVGDLIATCSSTASRNMSTGMRLGRGERLEDILGGTKMVAEGVRSSRVLLELAAAHGVDMPIVEQVVRVCHEGTPVDEALVALMSRSAKPEIR
jgi:glycerol-3-phosphate dehydrogenase (NAD(P)+)